MKVWTSEKLAISKAGHDKGSLNVVLEETPEYLLLVDGRLRTLDHPKKKNPKHVQLITHLPEELIQPMREITLDAHVRKILKEYRLLQGMQRQTASKQSRTESETQEPEAR